jgi:mannose-6-phosphate isomerase
MKVLAAAQPLSLQVHPTKEQAVGGFAKENAAGVSLTDPRRNYKDANHKPEMMLALTDFSALCGFRDPELAAQDIETFVGAPEPGSFAARLLGVLRGGDESLGRGDVGALGEAFGTPNDGTLDPANGLAPNGVPGGVPNGIQAAFTMLLDGGDEARAFVRVLSDGAKEHPEVPAAETVRFAGEHFGDDPGVAAALLLNRVELGPGDALYLGAGIIHAYLHGLGIEAMASSDNVLRGGLTPKHIDMAELTQVVTFQPTEPERIAPQPLAAPGVREIRYLPPTAEFAVSDVTIAEPGTSGYELPSGPAIVLALSGRTVLRAEAAHALPGSTAELTLERGQSAFVPAYEKVRVSSSGPARVVTVFAGSPDA